MRLILFITWLLFLLGNSQKDGLNHLSHINPSASAETQKSAVEGVIQRLLPNHFHMFQVEIGVNDFPKNTFQIIKNANETFALIKGSNGISACKGFHYYLKYYLNCHISWSGNQLINIPKELPNVSLMITSPSQFIYYQNVCTWSYSFSWWNWDDWRRHIDWMAMMGISLTIAPIQESIWEKIYRNIGMTDNEINEHFAGPSFQAWQRMGNIRGWGGPLSKSYREKQLKLQKQIIKAQRELGMIVAIPAFAGHVPQAFKRIFPNSNYTQVSLWNRFPSQYCCPLFIEPSDLLFQFIGENFLKEIISTYETDHIYFSDPFNEIIPNQSDVNYISSTSKNVYQAMISVDPNAIWLLQGWMFVTNLFWRDELIKSFLIAVPQGRMIILDLMSEQFPQYERTRSYYGQPFIWCMLHNFGGTLGMHGSVNIVNQRILLAQQMINSTMIGVGITPEGINQNYIMYEFTLERGWSNVSFNLDAWFERFIQVRYGQEDSSAKEAWKLLRNSVYSYHGLIKLHGKYTIARRPGIKISPWIWYNPDDVKEALNAMLNAEKNLHRSSLFQHDLVDITRQFLQILGDYLYINIVSAYKQKNETLLIDLSARMLELFYDLDKILATNSNFLLGNWLEAAKNMTRNNSEEIQNEFNARNQITTWGPNGQIVDYATKQWSGMVKDFFLPRWRLFLTQLQISLAKNLTYNENNFKRKVFSEIENPFNFDRKIYSTTPFGDPIQIASEILKKWKNIFEMEILIKSIPKEVEHIFQRISRRVAPA